MPILEVEVENNIILGKYGSSYLDIQRPGKNIKRLVFTEETINPFLSDDPLVCRPNLTKSENRPDFAIERGDIPAFNCDTPTALQKEVEFLRGNNKSSSTDPFLTDDPNIFQDIKDGDFLDVTSIGNSEDEIDLLVPVSGISFSFFDKAGIQGRLLDTPRIIYSFGLKNEQLQIYGCSDGNDITSPQILTDVRNREGINLARNPGRHVRWGWSYWDMRFYLEIRHGLNTKKYTTQVHYNSGDTPDGTVATATGFRQTQFKNTFTLTKTRAPANTQGSGFFGGGRPRFNPLLQIPRGVISVTFNSDPCDVSGADPSGEL